ncbi:MAG: PQQ-binding-like beta-propeller repeat protein [Pirellulaceae bacterium]|nr:PQQ-binding-like beta-propeller repeat protein [Pirellulaceae bacterium]
MSRLAAFRLPAIGLVLWAAPLVAADWCGFRGPGGTGFSGETGLPTTWSATENVAWKTELPGPGASSPIIIGDKVLVTCFRGAGTSSLARVLVCADRASGKILWTKEVAAKSNEDRYGGQLTSHGYASSTPISDGDKVFVFYGKSGVLAYDLAGNDLWQADVGSGSAPMGWGSGTSPTLYKNLVIVNAGAESEALVALDKSTGKQAWRADSGSLSMCWGSPIIVTSADGRDDLVLCVPQEIWGFNPETGKLRWYCDGIAENAMCTSVVSKDGVVYAIGGRRGGAVAVKAGGRGDVNKDVVWRKSVGSYVTSPVIVGEHLYWVSDNGTACCLKLIDGETVFRERIAGGGQLYGSVTAADGKLFAFTRNSGAAVIAAEPAFKQLAHNKLDGDAGTFNSTPAVHQGQLLVRSDEYLYCLGQK